jgi:hypothetical protein
MESHAFDQLTMSMATGQSRRQLLRRLVGGAIGLVAIRASASRTLAQSCAGIQESCEELECCFGYGCNEDNICIAAAECADFGEGCLTHEQCCGTYFCGETGICIAAAECADFDQVCKVDENCCDDLICGEDGKCREIAQSCAGIQESCIDLDCCYGYGCNENSICIAAAECAEFGQGCLTDEQCCDDLVCSSDGTCTAISLPSTGIGHAASPANQVVGLTAAAALAALIGGQRLRDRSDAPQLEAAPAPVNTNRHLLPNRTINRWDDAS